MQIKNVAKKLLICSLSLVMIGGSTISTTQISAHSNHHVKTVKVSFSNTKYKPLNFDQLLKVMTKDYNLYNHTNLKNNNKHRQSLSEKYYRMIMCTLWAKLKHYNKAQLKQLCDNPDASVICYSKKQNINHIKFISNYSISGYIHSRNLVKTNRVPQLSKQDTPFDTKIRRYLVNDINKTRIKYGKKPLIVDNVMQQVANYRAKKVLYGYEHQDDCLKYEHISRAKLDSLGGSTDNWIHGEDTHTSGGEYLEKHGYNPTNWAANAGPMNYDQTASYNNALYKYPSNSPKHIAYNINDDYINNDNFYPEYNGHRKAELDRYTKYVGVGVAYDPSTQLFADNEQFYE